MIAADHEHLDMQSAQPIQKRVQQQHCTFRRHRTVINITGNEQDLDFVFFHPLYDLIEHIRLFLEHGKTVDRLAKMQIGNVHHFHNTNTPIKEAIT